MGFIVSIFLSQRQREKWVKVREEENDLKKHLVFEKEYL